MNFLTKLKKAFMPKIAPTAVGTTALVVAGSATASGGGGLAEQATAAISGGTADLQTVGIAIIAVVAGVWVIKRVIALIR
ncbi:hypothetical protein [Acinetobacter populi]|uniref:Methyltransferase n=1 Tax=Acinetobacter populi TaxID=1582270 RepID=A0A1Z9YTK3_9GAMM|nr:hypothetical protein [Acinetobacter populi]OUY05513.1 hypothetical protein CAP51_17025 [Acinetobacter populi]